MPPPVVCFFAVGIQNQELDRKEAWQGLEDLRPLLTRFLLARCRDRGLVEDLVQETLIRAASRRNRLRQSRSLKCWVLSIACNVLSDQRRKEARMAYADLRSTELEAREAAEYCTGPRDGLGTVRLGGWRFGDDEALGHLPGAFGRLRPADQKLLDAFYGEGGSCRTVARELGMTAPVVKLRLYRARERLRRSLKRSLSQGGTLWRGDEEGGR